MLGHSQLPDFRHLVPKPYKVCGEAIARLPARRLCSSAVWGLRQRGVGELGTTPQSIDTLYKLNGQTSTNANNSQAIAAFLKYGVPLRRRTFSRGPHVGDYAHAPPRRQYFRKEDLAGACSCQRLLPPPANAGLSPLLQRFRPSLTFPTSPSPR